MDGALKTPPGLSTNADLFVRALWPDVHRCLGKRLLDLTVGHVLLLRRIESPLALGGAPDAADVALAVFICSRPWRRALAAMRRPWLGLRLIPLGIRAWLSGTTAVRHLGAYLRRGLSGPRWWPVNKPGTTASSIEHHAPYWLSILIALESELGVPYLEAMDTPVAAALWRISALREREESIQLVSDDEMAGLARSPHPFGSAHSGN